MIGILLSAGAGALTLTALGSESRPPHLPSRHIPFAWRFVPVWGGGAIMTVEVSPHDPDLVLAGCDVGGPFRSKDGGRSWRPVSSGLDTRGDRAVADFLWDPKEPDRVYLAAGECFGRPRGSYGGLWCSTDAGKSWSLVSRKVRFSGFGSVPSVGKCPRLGPGGRKPDRRHRLGWSDALRGRRPYVDATRREWTIHHRSNLQPRWYAVRGLPARRRRFRRRGDQYGPRAHLEVPAGRRKGP